MKNKKNIIIILSIILVIVIAFLIYLFVFKKNLESQKYIEYPIVYLDGDKLMMWQSQTNSKTVLDDEYSTKNNSSLIISYANTTNNMLAYINDENLYLYNVKTQEKEKISSTAESDLNFSKNDKYLTYLDDGGDLFSYNIETKIKTKLTNVEGYQMVTIAKITDDNIFYTISGNDSDDLYTYTLNKAILSTSTSEVISENISFLQLNEDETKIIYVIEDDDFYSYYAYDIKSNTKDKIIQNGYIFNNNDDYSEIIYLTESKEKIDILEDDEYDNDPVSTELKESTCTYSAYYKDLCTWEQYLYDDTYTYYEQTSKKEVNDEIRESASDITLYDIYYQKDGVTEKIASNVLTAISNGNDVLSVAYVKVNDKVKISTLTSLDDFENWLYDNEEFYYKVNTTEYKLDIKYDDLYQLLIESETNLYFLNNDSELYYINNKDNTKELIDTNVSYIFQKDDKIYYIQGTEDIEYYDALKTVKGTKSIEIATKISSFDFENKKLYIYNDCDGNTCNYSIYEDELKTLFEDVYNVKKLNDNNYYILKNYSSKNSTYDLYRYSNGSLIQIAFDVKSRYSSVFDINN
jgi:hypothetical protein